ncbi:MAG: hypothetical protein LBT36_02530 [Oscillospiraceae bacterium]|nr:hypothetical protein [Oscillospiraceae bacterium]
MATTDGVHVDEHFGRARTMTVFTTDADGAILTRETRAGMAECACEGHGAAEVGAFLATLEDCPYVLVKKIGPEMHRALAARGATVFELTGGVAEAAVKIAAYDARRGAKISEGTR